MTVRDLIEKLKQFSEDDLVMVDGYEGGFCFVGEPQEFDFRLNVNSASYFGPHEIDEDVLDYREGYKKVKAVLITRA